MDLQTIQHVSGLLREQIHRVVVGQDRVIDLLADMARGVSVTARQIVTNDAFTCSFTARFADEGYAKLVARVSDEAFSPTSA